MSVFKTERPTDTQLKQQRMADIARQRKINRRAFIDESKVNQTSESILENVNAIDESKATTSKLDRLRNDKLIMERRNRELGLLESRLTEEGFQKCYDTAIFEMVYNACWVDDDVKEKTINQMLEAYHNVKETLDKAGIKPVSEAEESVFIKNVKEVVMEAAKKTAKRIAKNAKDSNEDQEGIQKIRFEMTGTEADALDTNLSELNHEDLSELVKKKVLTVIQDEQESGKKKSEIFNEIEELSKPKEDDAEAAKSQEDIVSNKTNPFQNPSGGETSTPAKESTSLLDAMLEAENIATTETVEEEPKPSVTESKTYRDIHTAERTRRSNRYIGTSLFECIMTNALRTVNENITTENVEILEENDVMDAAFMDTVMTYTVLETFHSLGLYKFDNTTTRKLTNYYMAN